jgi:chromosome segregation ATPase
MSQEITRDLNGDRPFEERVFARFDGIEEYLRSLDSRVGGLDSRVQVLESRAYDTKPIWEKALKEILETRLELKETRDELRGEVNGLRAEVKETRIGLNDLRYDLNTFKREVTARLDEIQMVVIENRVVVRRAHERIDNLEAKPT